MTNTVDNRVVQMGFDNGQFEKGVATSTSSLDKLKKSLNFDEASKGFLNLGNAAKGFSLAHIADGVQNVSSKFSALGVIGFTVLQNLTNAAMQYGHKIVSNILDPIKTGLSEYETQLNAIQTVLANTASKGTTLDDVNKALNTLNTYSDKTIYNFTEMTRNIGTFTAAGVDLDTSVNAIKGIANLAAVSGSNSQQASTAMYQLSQALATGTVRLMDWNSVVNAGMGGQVFQDALLETARVHGIAIDDMIKKEGSFRESLQEGWLTSDILTETLSKFTGDLTAEQLKSMGYTEEQIAGIIKLGQTANDAATKVKTFSQLQQTIQEAIQSGWAKSWQIVLGDFEEAKAFFTEVSDTLGPLIAASADARNKILQDWKDAGGRLILIDSLRNIFQGLLSIMKPIKEAFRDIFGPGLTANNLMDITRAIFNFSEKLKISGETADKIKRIFSGLFAGLDILKDLVITLVGAFFDLTSSVAPSGGSILDFLVKIADYVVNLRNAIKTTDFFGDVLIKIKGIVERIRDTIVTFANTVKEKFKIVKDSISGAFGDVDLSPLETFFGKFNVRIKPFEAIFRTVGAILKGFMNIAKKSAPVLFKVAGAIGEFMKNLGSSIVEGVANLDFSKLFDTINSGLFAALLLAIKKFVDSGSGFVGEAKGVFGGITGILDGVRGSLEAWQANLKAKTLLTIAFAIGVLTASLVVLSMIDSQKLTTALLAVTAMFTQLITSMTLYNKASPGGSIKANIGLLAMTTSILILSVAVSKLAKLKPEEIGQSLIAIGLLSTGLVIMAKLLDKNTGSILKGSLGLVAFSVSLLILTSVVEKLGNLDPARMTNGLIGVGIMLAEIVAFMKLVDLDKMGMTKGLGLLMLAGSLMIMSTSIEKFSAMDPVKLQQGLIALGAVLLEISAFTRLTGDGKGIIATSIGMAILSGALLILTNVIGTLANLSWEQLGKGLAGMGGALLIIVAAVNMFPPNMIVTALGLVLIAGALVIISKALSTMGDMTWEEIGKGLVALAGSLAILTLALYAMSGTLAGSAALLVAAAALAVLTPVLTTLGGMGLTEIGLALLALAGVFALLAIAGYLLTPVIPTLLGLGVSMMLIGVAAALVGVGLLAFSIGLAAIAASGGVAAVVIVGMIATLLGIIPLIIKTLIDAIIMFGNGIIMATPVVRDAILALLLAVLDIIIKVTPKLLQALTILLKGLIQLIVDVIPDFIRAVILLLTTLLKEIAAKMPDFIQSGFDILIAFLSGVRDNIGEVVTVVSEIVTNFLTALGDNLPDIIQAGFDLIVDFINGMADAVDKNMQPMLDAMGRLATNMITGLCTAITKGAASVLKALKDIVDAAIKAIKEKLLIKSPSKVFAKIGSYIPLGLVVGIRSLKGKVMSTMEDLGRDTANKMKDAISKINMALNDNIDMNPVIRPVMDLSDIKYGGEELNKIMAKRSFDVVPIVSRTALVAANMPGQSISQTGINTGSSISLIQNNYSPKALSRIEIYRQTRNQLMTLKGLVKP